ncbi:MAG: hypothetical protein E5V85_25810 [Mesorhizobium sp.]|nr:MAG: hypothetical protein E5V85_25810 [Mesorhizobium sp.]
MIDDVHYTSLYSIESYFVTEEYIRYIVDKFSKGHLGKADTDAICAEYKRRFNSMLASVRSVCALMLKTRMLGLHPDFDAISVNDLFDLAGESPVVRRNRWAVLQQNWLGPVQLAARELRKVIPTLALNDQGRWLRGKLAMQLARIALRLAVKSLPEASRGKAPDANLISAESFRYAKQFIGEMPSLAEYCAAEGAGAV